MNDILKTKKLNGYLSGEIVIPPDKSISHRSLILGALASFHSKEKVKVKNISIGEDCVNTMKILSDTGVIFNHLSEREILIDAKNGFKTPSNMLNCGNSGTTTRLLAGLFSSIDNFQCTLIGDDSLVKRPMKRIINPIELMGGKIISNDNKMPLKIIGKHLDGITYHSPIPSAQVKSAILFAGLNAENKTTVIEDVLSRNHSEIMLKYLGAKINTGKTSCNKFYSTIEKSSLVKKDIEVAGDISSATFFIIAAMIVPNSHIIIKNVGINPTRTGIIDVLDMTCANYLIKNKKVISGELVADIEISYKKDLKPFHIKGDLIPRLIDEIPAIAVLMACINGKSEVSDAKDLRNKESDRISEIVNSFKLLGINVEEKEDGFIITGGEKNKTNVRLKTHLDHRLVMSYYIISLVYDGEMEIEGKSSINTSFPEFLKLMESLRKSV